MYEQTLSSLVKADPQQSWGGKLRRAPELETRIAREQINLLLDLGNASRFSIFGAVIIVGLAFYPSAPIWTIGIPLGLQVIAEICFHYVRKGFKADPDAGPRAILWAQRHMWVTFISGSTWAAAALLWLPNSSYAHQMFFMLVLACLSMATSISRANYTPAAFTYIATASIPAFILLLIEGNPFASSTLALGGVLLLTLAGWTRRINRNYYQAFRLRFQNEELAERMARAHSATEQKRHDAVEAERRAIAASRAKSEFLTLLGNEVGIPLNALMQMAKDLQAAPLNEAQQNIAEAIEGTSQMLRRQFDDMVEFSQMEAHALELETSAFNPGELVKSVVRLMRPQARERSLSLELDLAPKLPLSMTGDRDRLRQVLVSLISNSIKFTETGGIILRVHPVPSIDGETLCLRFSVLDTGIGMTPEAQTTLFDSFTQGEALDQGRPEGMGLGLAICDRLVKLMGGQLRVDSALGQGSTFWFLLPQEHSAVPAIESGGSSISPAQELLIDHDLLYELEHKLGTEGVTDHMVRALENILSLHQLIQTASASRDPGLLKMGIGELHRAAGEIGLVAISSSAGSIGQALEQGQNEEAINAVPRLQQKITATWYSLGKAFPSLGN